MKPKLNESGLAIIPDKNDKSTMACMLSSVLIVAITFLMVKTSLVMSYMTTRYIVVAGEDSESSDTNGFHINAQHAVQNS